MLEPGQTIDGRFVVEALVGQGGLAEVYRVRHVELGSLHALKLLVWKKKQLEDRLLLEGRIQAQLRHPNVVAVTDLVRHDGQVGLLMEYVDHESLEDFVHRAAPLPVNEALPLFAAVVAGVTAAHDAGVLHRDLKPANVMLSKSASGVVPKVTDFGIAKVVQDMQGGRTAAGVTMGTPGYLAPEQILDSADADQRADVFALGAILYEMLTGCRAFADEEGEVSVRSTLEGEVTPIETLVEGIDLSLAAAIRKSLERDRDNRFADCRSFASGLFVDRPDLLGAVTGRHVGGPISLAGVPAAAVVASSQETFAPTEPSRPTTGSTAGKSVGLLAVGIGFGGIAAALALGAVWFSLQPGDTAPPVAPEPAPIVAAAPPDAPTLEQELAGLDPASAAKLMGEPVPDLPAEEPSETSAGRPEAPKPVPVGEQPDAEEVPAAEDGVGSQTEDPVVDEPVPVEPAGGELAGGEPPEPEEVVEEPAVAELVEPAPDLVIENLAAMTGTWKGTANGRRLQLRIDSVSGGSLSGEMTFYQGPSVRTMPATGTVDPVSGAVTVTSGVFDLRGSSTDSAMSGTYMAGKKSLPWSLTKGG